MSHDFRLRPIRFDMALQILIAGAAMYRKAWDKVEGIQPHVYYVEHYGKDNKPELLIKTSPGPAYPFMADTADLLASDWVVVDMSEAKVFEILMRLMANTMQEESRMRADNAREQGR